MIRGPGVVVFAAVLSSACGGPGRSPSTPSPPAVVTSPQPPASGTAGACVVRPAGPEQPITDPAGPYFHDVAIAHTADGLTITDPQIVLTHASVPDGVRLPDGRVAVYYVNGATGGLWVATGRGDQVDPVGPISLGGVENPSGVVDPDVTLLPDGRVRMAYLSGFGAPGGGDVRAMCLADSSDGRRFEVAATALDLGRTDTDTDPSIAALRDGTWLMALSRGQRSVLARSADGLSFVLGETLTYGGVPELAVLPDGRVRLYVCAQGIESYVSVDEGRSWQRERTVLPPGTLGRRIVCDPSRVASTDLFVFKVAN